MATLATITATDRDGNIIGKFPQPPYFLLDYNDIPVLLNEPFKDDTDYLVFFPAAPLDNPYESE